MKHIKTFENSINWKEIESNIEPWGPENIELMDKLLDQFEKKYPLEEKSWEEIQEIKNALWIGYKYSMESTNEGRFVGSNGEFKPTKPSKKGYISIKELEEMCEYLYNHNNMDNKEKLKHILDLESLIKDLIIDQYDGIDVTYVPTWSKKMKEYMKLK